MKKLILLHSLFVEELVQAVVSTLNQFSNDSPLMQADIEELVNKILELFAEADHEKLDVLTELVGDDMLESLIDAAAAVVNKIDYVLGQRKEQVVGMIYSGAMRTFAIAIKEKDNPC